jgi:hypothetical protein
LVNNTSLAGRHQIYNHQEKKSKARMSNFCSSDNHTQIIDVKENDKREGKKINEHKYMHNLNKQLNQIVY